MNTQTVVWTVLPDPSATRTTDGSTTLTLVASPRLGTDAPAGSPSPSKQLSDYADVAGWADLQLGIAVEIVGAGAPVTVPAVFVDDRPDAALWHAIFPPTQLVTPFVFPSGLAQTPSTSYPAAVLAQSLASEYAAMFADSAALGANPWDAVDRLVHNVGITGAAAGSGAPSVSPSPAAWDSLAEFHRAAATPVQRTNVPAPMNLGPAAAPSAEFHTIIAALADHPALMSRLGLRRRITVALPTGLSGAVTIRAVPSHTASVRDYRPRTRCVLALGQLALGTADGVTGSPYLPMDDTTRFTVIDVDTDRSGLALRAYAEHLGQLPRDQPPPQLHPPALRSDGIFVAQADLEAELQAVLRRAEELNTDLAAGNDGGGKVLEPLDLWHGYRVDVFDVAAQRWYPLCRRVVTYTVGGAALSAVNDEGYVSAGLGHCGSDAQPSSLAHESLFRWSGWSLVATPPGKMLGLDDAVADPVPPPGPGLPFAADIVAAPGTLPALRYGRDYRLRARRVDIAGASVAFTADAAVACAATPTLRYRRYEPVPAPVPVPRRAVSSGESAHVLVVRTDNSDPNTPVAGPTCERHLLAPKAAVALLECHGVLDVAGENRPDPDAYALLAARDSAVVTGTPDPHANGSPFVDADTMELPWLPDPLARGVALHGLPGTAELTVPWPQGAAWFDRHPMRLVISPGNSSGTQPPRVDPAARTVAVSLPPGAVTLVSLSSLLNPGDEELMAAWDWFAAAGGPQDQIAANRAAAVAGAVSQLCPARELTVVHALRCPAEPPAFSALQVTRGSGDTSYTLSDSDLQFDQATTHSVYVRTSWTDIVDDPELPAPRSVQCSADLVPGDSAAGIPATTAPAAFEVRHHIADTRHHTIQCTPVATSRFAGYFAEQRTVALPGEAAVPVAAGFVPGTVVVRDSGSGATTFSIDRDVLVDYEAGTVARRPGSAVPDDGSVEVEFVAPPVTRSGAAVTVTVPASAPPAPPVLHSVVPAFQWRRQRIGSTLVSIRGGNLLRIYLKRPWFDSGDGEMLAVLVAPENVSDTDPSIDICSHVNPELVFGSGGASQPLGRADFPRTHTFAHGPSGTWALGHTVEFDPVLRLWFCDVQVNRGPFVRLRVARLQPASLGGPGLSQIVDGGFHQPSVERTLTVAVNGTQATVSVTGPMPTGRVSEFSAAVAAGPAPANDAGLWDNVNALSTTPLVGDTGTVSGTLTLPAAPGVTPLRLLVRENQVLPGTTVPGVGHTGAGPQDPQVRRLSYFDVVSL